MGEGVVDGEGPALVSDTRNPNHADPAENLLGQGDVLSPPRELEPEQVGGFEAAVPPGGKSLPQ